jgi:hypothetical protein
MWEFRKSQMTISELLETLANQVGLLLCIGPYLVFHFSGAERA